jgi:hypothetical protein
MDIVQGTKIEIFSNYSYEFRLEIVPKCGPIADLPAEGDDHLHRI